MVDRIRLILKAKNLSASTFADEIGVQRSAISHILSGRNNPSLDFIQKILRRYPEIRTEWLLNGKGEMSGFNLFNTEVTPEPSKLTKATSSNSESIAKIPTSENAISGLDFGKSDEMLSFHDLEKPQIKPKQHESRTSKPVSNTTKKMLKNIVPYPFEKDDRKVEKIVILYTDKTFREFTPED